MSGSRKHPLPKGSELPCLKKNKVSLDQENKAQDSVGIAGKTLEEELRSGVSNLFEPYGIDVEDVFCLFEKGTYNCPSNLKQWKPSWTLCEKGSYTYLDITLNRYMGHENMAVIAFTEELNKAIPELKAEHELIDRPPLAPSSSRTTFRLRLDTMAIKNRLLPWIDHQLKASPEEIFNIWPYMSSDIMSKFVEVSASLGIDVSKCDFVEETICEIVNYYYNLGPEFFKVLAPLLTTRDIINLAVSYCPIPSLTAPHKLEIVTTESSYQPYATEIEGLGRLKIKIYNKEAELQLKTEVSNGKYIVDFFNSRYPGSAHLIETKEEKGNNKVKLRVHGAALMNKEFLDHFSLSNISMFHSSAKLESYREKSRLDTATSKSSKSSLALTEPQPSDSVYKLF